MWIKSGVYLSVSSSIAGGAMTSFSPHHVNSSNSTTFFPQHQHFFFRKNTTTTSKKKREKNKTSTRYPYQSVSTLRCHRDRHPHAQQTTVPSAYTRSQASRVVGPNDDDNNYNNNNNNRFSVLSVHLYCTRSIY